jgi:hypothetical protein
MLLIEKSKTNGAECEGIRKQVNSFMRRLGFINACFAKLVTIITTDKELFQAREACGAMIHKWRSQFFKMLLKAHICDYHMCDLNKAYGGIGGMDESFVKHHHKIAGHASERTCNVPGIERQSMSALNFEALSADKDLKANVI